MEAAKIAAAFDQGQHRVLVRITALLGHSLLVTDKGFVGFNDATVAAYRRKLIGAHCLADAVAHEPSRLKIDPQGAMKLIRADTLLARTHEINRLKPAPRRNVAILKNCADLDGEFLTAGIALVGANASAFALHLGNALVLAAVGTHWIVGPKDGFDESVCLLRIVQVGVGQNGHWNPLLNGPNVVQQSGSVKLNIALPWHGMGWVHLTWVNAHRAGHAINFAIVIAVVWSTP